MIGYAWKWHFAEKAAKDSKQAKAEWWANQSKKESQSDRMLEKIEIPPRARKMEAHSTDRSPLYITGILILYE